MKNNRTYHYEEIINIIKDEEVEVYLKDICKMSNELVKRQIERFKRHKDIYGEFKYWFLRFKHGDDTINYAVDEPVTEQGYTAYSLYQEFGNNIMPIGIFNLLISLREETQETLDYIKKGLPKKWF